MKIAVFCFFSTFVLPICGVYYSKKNNEYVTFCISIILFIISLWYILLISIEYFFSYDYIYFISGTLIYSLCVYFIVKICSYIEKHIIKNVLNNSK